MFQINPNLIVECTTNGGCNLIRAVVISVGIFMTLLTGFAYGALLERRILAFMQSRIGPEPRRSARTAATRYRRHQTDLQGRHCARRRGSDRILVSARD